MVAIDSLTLLQVITGGTKPQDMDAGYFYSPTLLGNAKPDMRIFKEETFAPVMPMFTCALRLALIADATPCPLLLCSTVVTLMGLTFGNARLHRLLLVLHS